MILRAWRGIASADNPTGYPEYFRNRVVPELEMIAGFREASLVRRAHGREIEFLVLTRWDSMEAIRAFAGQDPGKAVVEPGAVATLLRFDERVEHYEIVEEVAPASRGKA